MHSTRSKNSCSSARQHGENVYVCVIASGCLAGQGLTIYILSTPFKQALRTAASRQPHQTLEGFGDHWWQSNNKKKYGRSQGIFHLLTVGHLLHKRPVLCLTYLETEVAGSFATPRGAQADWKLNPKHLTCPLTWERAAILIHRENVEGLLPSSFSRVLRGKDNRLLLHK